LDRQNKDDIGKDVCRKCVAPEIMTTFLALAVVFNYIITITIVRSNVEQIAANHQKTSEDQETDENDKTEHERVTN
jgi:hypothetical protein